MNGQQNILTLTDLEEESRTQESLAEARRELRARLRPAATWRDIQVVPSGRPAADRVAGLGFVSSRPRELQREYEALINAEERRTDPFRLLIAQACGIAEQEIVELLVTPARPVAARLVAAMTEQDQVQADGLARWSDGKAHATLGTACAILLALRRGAEEPTLAEFLQEHFRPDCIAAMRDKAYGGSWSRLVQNYRNPATHRFKEPFQEDDYAGCARLLVGQKRFADWEKGRPVARAASVRRGDTSPPLERKDVTLSNCMVSRGEA